MGEWLLAALTLQLYYIYRIDTVEDLVSPIAALPTVEPESVNYFMVVIDTKVVPIRAEIECVLLPVK